MNLNNFDLNLLVALDALLTERNVTRAAERLFVSQPAMSNALTRIRDRFDDQLLVRRGRVLELTPLAQTLIGPVRELILQAQKFLEADYRFDPEHDSRTFRVAMSDYCAMVLVGPLMKILSAEAPQVRCEVSVLTERTAASLVAGDIDMCITAQHLRMLDLNVDETVIERQSLFTDDFVCAVDADNDEVGDVLSFDDYSRLPHAVTRFGGGTVSMEEQALRRMDLQLVISAVAPTFASLPMLLAGTPLVITIQRKLASRLAAAVPMRLYKPPVEIPDLVETLYWHQRSEYDKAHIWMREAMVRASAQL